MQSQPNPDLLIKIYPRPRTFQPSILPGVSIGTSMTETEMKVDAVRAKALVSQLQDVQQRIASVAKGRNVSLACDATSRYPASSHLGASLAVLRCLGLSETRLAAADDGPVWQRAGRSTASKAGEVKRREG